MNETKNSPTMGYGWAGDTKDQEFFHPSETRAPIDRLVARFGGRCVELVERPVHRIVPGDPIARVERLVYLESGALAAGGMRTGPVAYDVTEEHRMLRDIASRTEAENKALRDKLEAAEESLKVLGAKLEEERRAHAKERERLELRAGSLRIGLKSTLSALVDEQQTLNGRLLADDKLANGEVPST